MNSQPATAQAASPSDAPQNARIYNRAIECIGKTPLVRVPRLSAHYDIKATLLVKLENTNPLLSDKDRAALAIITAEETAGTITAGQTTLITASAGNFAISLAGVAAASGYTLKVVMPESAGIEQRKTLRLLGADITLTPTENGMKGAIARAQEISAATQNAYLIDPFTHTAPLAHYKSVAAAEIWSDTQGQIDVFIAGVGTGALLIGTAQGLKSQKPDLSAYAVEPSESAVLSGEEPGPHKIRGIGAGFIPPLYQEHSTALIDGVIKVSSAEALQVAKDIARLEGIACGIAAGANVAAAIKAAKNSDFEGKTIVTPVTCPAERSIAAGLFDDLLQI